MNDWHWTDRFVEMNACKDAIEEGLKYPTFIAWWAATERADWMLWVWARVNPSPGFWLACRKCAGRVAHLWPITPVCREYLETGNPALRKQASREARKAAWAVRAPRAPEEADTPWAVDAAWAVAWLAEAAEAAEAAETAETVEERAIEAAEAVYRFSSRSTAEMIREITLDPDGKLTERK